MVEISDTVRAILEKKVVHGSGTKRVTNARQYCLYLLSAQRLSTDQLECAIKDHETNRKLYQGHVYRYFKKEPEIVRAFREELDDRYLNF